MSAFRTVLKAVAVLAGIAGVAAPASAGGSETRWPSAYIASNAATVAVDWNVGRAVVAYAGHFSIAHLLPSRAAPKLARLGGTPLEGLRASIDATRLGRSDMASETVGPDEMRTGAIPAARAATAASGLFGSVALPFRKLSALERLKELRPAMARPTACGDAGCKARVQLIREFIEPAKGRRDLVDRVNRAVNGLIAYRSDRDAFGVVDRWAGPAQTLARGFADCEDYALLKMALLAERGVEPAAMTLVVLRDRSREAYHAVLAVQIGGERLILDNLEVSVRRDTELAHYMPLYSISDGKGYIHGRRAGAPARMAGLGNLSAIAPGEGIAQPEFTAAYGPR
ncbi:MAG: transglutaminase-like cysteine peptidase [Rhizobiaceae bacterium]|nr:transglutaminase-like cysteine peptidase [Rhizobiaceae bacterium]